MKWKHQTALGHAMQMVIRNLRSYTMLSVTVVFSFSILLGYLAFSDSTLYNRYKDIFHQPENVVLVDVPQEELVPTALKMARNADPEAKFYTYYSAATRLPQYANVSALVRFLPEGRRPVYEPVNNSIGYLFLGEGAVEMQPILGKKYFELYGNEAIISQALYEALGQSLPFTLYLPLTKEDETTTVLTLEVVGVVEDNPYYDLTISQGEDGKITGRGTIYTTQGAWEKEQSEQPAYSNSLIWFACENPHAVAASLEQLGLYPSAVCEAQTQAREHLRTQSDNKFYTVLLLLLVLGINLYSSFGNALAERKFEIGVKQALGASPGQIILQFMLESIIVMAANILISVVLVADAMLIYKFIQWTFYGVEWVAEISLYSIAMFLICAVSLTVVFSGIFAYKSSRVEIAKHLKAE